jgi:hypothetical protein
MATDITLTEEEIDTIASKLKDLADYLKAHTIKLLCTPDGNFLAFNHRERVPLIDNEDEPEGVSVEQHAEEISMDDMSFFHELNEYVMPYDKKTEFVELVDYIEK